MAAKPRKYKGFGTIAGVKRVLWTILQRVEARLEDGTGSDESQRHWANVGVQAALAYAKIHETQVLEQDMHTLEDLTHGNGHQA